MASAVIASAFCGCVPSSNVVLASKELEDKFNDETAQGFASNCLQLASFLMALTVAA